MELYESRLVEMHEEMGEYSEKQAAVDDARWLKGVTTDYMEDLTYTGKKRIHNLKYFTWVEQQGKTYEEIQDSGTSVITGLRSRHRSPRSMPRSKSSTQRLGCCRIGE
jgi:hypothetical protein